MPPWMVADFTPFSLDGERRVGWEKQPALKFEAGVAPGPSSRARVEPMVNGDPSGFRPLLSQGDSPLHRPKSSETLLKVDDDPIEPLERREEAA